MQQEGHSYYDSYRPFDSIFSYGGDQWRYKNKKTTMPEAPEKGKSPQWRRDYDQARATGLDQKEAAELADQTEKASKIKKGQSNH